MYDLCFCDGVVLARKLMTFLRQKSGVIPEEEHRHLFALGTLELLHIGESVWEETRFGPRGQTGQVKEASWSSASTQMH